MDHSAIPVNRYHALHHAAQDGQDLVFIFGDGVHALAQMLGHSIERIHQLPDLVPRAGPDFELIIAVGEVFRGPGHRDQGAGDLTGEEESEETPAAMAITAPMKVVARMRASRWLILVKGRAARANPSSRPFVCT